MATTAPPITAAGDRSFALPAVSGASLAGLGVLFLLCFALVPVEIEEAFGLPAHPLAIHVPVILVPLLALASVALVALPRWRARLGLLWGAFAVLCLASTVLSVGSGEAFIEGRSMVDATLRDHADAAETLRLVSFILTGAILLLLAADWLRSRATGPALLRGPVLALVLSIVVVPLALGAGFLTVRTGHLGATAAWGGNGP